MADRHALPPPMLTPDGDLVVTVNLVMDRAKVATLQTNKSARMIAQGVTGKAGGGRRTALACLLSLAVEHAATQEDAPAIIGLLAAVVVAADIATDLDNGRTEW